MLFLNCPQLFINNHQQTHHQWTVSRLNRGLHQNGLKSNRSNCLGQLSCWWRLKMYPLIRHKRTNAVWLQGWGAWSGQVQRQEVEWWLPGTEGGEEWTVFNGYRVSVWKDEKVLEMDGDGCAAMWRYLRPLNCTLKSGLNGKFCYVQFTTKHISWGKARTCATLCGHSEKGRARFPLPEMSNLVYPRRLWFQSIRVKAT